MKLIASSDIIENSIRNSTLELLYLNRFHSLINRSNLHEIGCLDFAMHKRKSLVHEHLASSSAYAMTLGMFSN